MYGKIMNGKLVPDIFQSTEEQARAKGIKPVEFTEKPNDGYCYKENITEQNDRIVCGWVRTGEKTVEQQLTDLQLALTELYEGELQ